MAEPEKLGDLADAKLENLKDNSSFDSGDQKQHGGARPGAGRPKGSENEDTKANRLALTRFKDRVHKATDRLFNAQLDAALGEKFLYVTQTIGSGTKKRRETTMVTDPEVIKQYLDGELESNEPDADYYFISTKAANNMAIDSLLNRAFGTPQKNVDVTSKGEGILSRMDDKDLQRIAGALGEALNGNNDDEPGQ